MRDSWKDFLQSEKNDSKESDKEISEEALQQNSNENDKEDEMTYTKEKLDFS